MMDGFQQISETLKFYNLEIPLEKKGLVNPFDVILYHGGDCRDGFCSAWLAKKAFPDIQMIPVQYGQAPPDGLKGKRVLIADFSYPLEVLVVLNDLCEGGLVVLDHHKSAEKHLKEFAEYSFMGWPLMKQPFVIFDNKKSGARLTYEFLWGCCVLPKEWNDLPIDCSPWLVNYVEDRDLWNWHLPNSRAVNAGIRMTDLTIEAWNDLYEKGWEEAERFGSMVRKREEQIVDSHVRHAAVIDFMGYKIPAVNCSCDLTSEVGEKLAEGNPFAMLFFDTGTGERVYSLRSTTGVGVDVGEIASQFPGGGGHKHAAGFTKTGYEIFR